jgi:hypothetical protein
MGHVLAVAMALFDPEAKGQRAQIAPDHDGADGVQKGAAGGARDEAFRGSGGDKLIQGEATFRLGGAGS